MPTPPFVLFGFDVNQAEPLAASIIDDVQRNFPFFGNVFSGGPDGMFAIETSELKMIQVRNGIITYLASKDQEHAGKLRFCVFLIRMQDGVIE